MLERNDEEFFIGYQPAAPDGIAARTRMFVLLALAAALVACLLALAGFQILPNATFEFGNTRTFEGTLVQDPYPALFVERPGASAGLPRASRYHLVAPFKFGTGESTAPFDHKCVRLEGTLVHRDGRTLIEVVPDSVQELEGAPLDMNRSMSLGEHTFVGEIVDSKCFLGVMNPGNMKPHRACAIRCISGGIPPVFCVRDEAGRAEYLLLVGENGEALNDEVLEFVALPLRITGAVERVGDQLILRASPKHFESL